MIYDEQDAKGSKMCPMTFNHTEPQACIGSACMLWRTVEIKTEDFVVSAGAFKTEAPAGDGWKLRQLQHGQIAWSRPVGVTGHCGLIKL